MSKESSFCRCSFQLLEHHPSSPRHNNILHGTDERFCSCHGGVRIRVESVMLSFIHGWLTVSSCCSCCCCCWLTILSKQSHIRGDIISARHTTSDLLPVRSNGSDTSTWNKATSRKPLFLPTLSTLLPVALEGYY
jgi:hypothetical protein